MSREDDERELQAILEKTPQAASRTKCSKCDGPCGPDYTGVILRGLPLGREYICGVCGIIQVNGLEHMMCDRCDGTGWVENDELFDEEMMEKATVTTVSGNHRGEARSEPPRSEGYILRRSQG